MVQVMLNSPKRIAAEKAKMASKEKAEGKTPGKKNTVNGTGATPMHVSTLQVCVCLCVCVCGVGWGGLLAQTGLDSPIENWNWRPLQIETQQTLCECKGSSRVTTS